MRSILAQDDKFNVLDILDNPAYVAVGLSTDNRMGEDAVMECVPENGQVRAYTSWTTPSPNLGVIRQGVVSILNHFIE